MLAMTRRGQSPLRMGARSGGFTLVELTAVIAIMAIFGSLAVPAFRGLLVNQRLAAAAGGFVAALNLARTEALQRSQKVHVGALEGNDWSSGWAVQAEPEGAMQTLRKFQRLPNGVSIDAALGDGFVRGLDYDSSGFSRRVGGAGFGAGCLTLKAESGRRASIIVSASGRARVCNPDVRGDCGSGVCGSVGK
jgi:type IV fimbrial biogenesis protein FimT